MESRPTVSRFTAFLLGLVVFVCVAMIGGTGYLKYQLDHAQTILAAPEQALTQTENPAEARLIAQNKAQFWAMGLTMASWVSLIIAAACTAGVYLILRDRKSAPMRALAQSIENMAKGDMRTGIWGIERRDTIGELARAVEAARFQFGQLPDLAVITDQGPIRMRFEGGSHSLFDATMKALSGHSENIRDQSAALAEMIQRQNLGVASLSAKVEDILHNIAERGQNGDKQIRQAVHDITGSTEGLKNAHAHAIDQLNRLIPHIQERAHGLSEITQLAGKQISHTLQSLAASEYSLKSNASGAQETLLKLSSTADNLGERLFGAINLLQAGGKVLAETTENIKNRLGQSDNTISSQQVTLDAISGRLEEVGMNLSTMQTKLAESFEAQKPQETPAVDLLTPMTSQFEEMKTQLAELQNHIGAHFAAKPEPAPAISLDPLVSRIDQISEQLSSLPAKLKEGGNAQSDFTALSSKIAELSDINNRVAILASALPGDLRQYMREEIKALEEQSKEAGSTPQQMQVALAPEMHKQLMDQWFQLSAQIEATRSSLAQDISQKIEKIEAQLEARVIATPTKSPSDEATQFQLEKQAEVLTELVGTLSLIDTHMQQLRESLYAERQA